MAGTSKKETALTYVEILSGTPLPARSLYILTGSDIFAFSEMEKVFRKKFLPDDPNGFNLARFDCDNSTKGSAIVNVCEEYPFGSERKLVILNNAHKLPASEGEKIKKYFENPSDTAVVLIFENEEEVKSASAGKFQPSRDLRGAVKNFGLHISCKLDLFQIKGWMRSRFQAEGKNITSGAVEALLESVGQDLWDLNQEIAKLSLYAGKKDSIREEDVRLLTSHRPQSKIFNLNEFAGHKNIRKSLLTLDELLKEKMAGTQILGALNNHFTFLFKIRSMIDSGETEESIAKSLKKHPFYIKKSMGQARNFARSSFETIFDLLARADGGIKSGNEERRIVELALIQICRLKE